MLLLDNSAWARLESPSLSQQRRADLADMAETGELGVCLPFLLEAGWSARSGEDHDELLGDLLQLPRFEINAAVEVAALDAQRALARRGHHRSASPADLLIAACAHVHGAGVLHYDRDYDVVSELTALVFDSRWLAPAGTL